MSADQPWIIVNPRSGAGLGTVNIDVNTTGLQPGNYSGVITVSSNGGIRSGSISFNLVPPSPSPPILSVSNNSFKFATTSTGESKVRILQISNNGGGTLDWRARTDTDSPWIELNHTNGSNNGSIFVTINTTDLSPGSYAGIITIESNEGTDQVAIKLNVLSPAPTHTSPVTPPAPTPPTSQPTTPTPPAPTQSGSNLMLFLILFIPFLIIVFFILKYLFFRTKGLKANSLTIPTKMYEGDSNIILLHLAEHDALVSNGTPKAMFFVDKQGIRQPSGIEIPSGFSPKSIEIELLAVGFDVEGEKRQKHELFGAMIYQWNISPTRSKDLEIGLVFRAEDAFGRIEPLGVITHKINVVKILGLTGRQIGTLTNVFGAFGGVLGIIVTLNQLGILNFK